MAQQDVHNLAREVIKIYNKADLAMKSVSSVCQEGCAYCCLRTVRIHVAEETLIGKYVNEQLAASTKKMIRNKLRRWLEFFNNETPQRSLTMTDILKFDQPAVKNRVECPFLILSRCSIYPVRPLVCRTHAVDDSPDLCSVNPVRLGDFRGIKILESGYSDLKKIPVMNAFSLLTYATAGHFGIDGPFRGIDWPLIDNPPTVP